MAVGDGHGFVFVAGLHRSGTTLLARLLAAHPEISGFSGTGAPAAEGQHLQSVYPSDHEYGRPGRFGFPPEMHLTEASPLVSEESAQRLFAEWAPHWDLSRPLLLEKSPPNLIKTRFLQALFPDSAFVVVVRHPIPVSIPTAKWRGTRRYDRLLDHWLRCHALFEADLEQLGRVHVLTYEQLVGDPAGVLEEVFEFLEVEPIPPSRTGRDGSERKVLPPVEGAKARPADAGLPGSGLTEVRAPRAPLWLQPPPPTPKQAVTGPGPSRRAHRAGPSAPPRSSPMHPGRGSRPQPHSQLRRLCSPCYSEACS
jgi:Sulfotransferase family